jgi:hypothetical protein
MIVPDVGVDEQEPDWVPDYDQDQRTRSFSDIRDFFMTVTTMDAVQ